MSKYQAALQEVTASECFKDCLMDDQEITPANIAEDMAYIAADIARGLEKLERVGHCPYEAAELLDGLATQTDILRILAAARLKLAEAAAADGISIVPAPSGATLH
ncbi:hypothetical protein PQR08_11465 [Caballeronia jiangsuensis]|uniref:Uncharacterized protein n=1 Tax=Caballeronia jiangsuensis TaxID=1458357 RepID=A0ABW9CK78_9BURK